MDWLLQRPIAHRGLHHADGEVPENSLTAFAKACRRDLPIELDLRLASEARVVVFHDAGLERMTGHSGQLAEVPWQVAGNLRLRGGDQRIPLLSEVLRLVAGQVPLLIELKSCVRYPELCARVASQIVDYRGLVAVQSFDPMVLFWFRRHCPRIPRGQLSGILADSDRPFHQRYVLRRMWLNILAAPDFIGYEAAALPNPDVARLRSRGLPVLAWTIRDAAAHRRVRAHADNIIFEGYSPDDHSPP